MARRVAVNKRRSAKTFRRNVRKTSASNVARPGRGGFRL